MTHVHPHAKRWLALIVQQPLPNHAVFAAHVAAGAITELCACGCQSFSFVIPEDVDLPPLTTDAHRYCELAFVFPGEKDVDILLWTDVRGYFSGATLMYGMVHGDGIPDPRHMPHLTGIWPSMD